MTTTHDVKPSLVGDFVDWTVADFLESLATSQVTGRLDFVPSGISLHFYQGDLISASGGEPLGSILLRRKVISEDELQHAVRFQDERWLGEVLLGEPFHLPAECLLNALNTQILMAINALVAERQACFMLYNTEGIPPKIFTRLPVNIALSEARNILQELQTATLPLASVLRLNPHSNDSQISLSSDEWAVAALCNGKRSLRSVLRRCMVIEIGWMRAYKAAVLLYKAGMLEICTVPGIYEIRPTIPQNIFFGRDLSKLFLDVANSQRNLAEIAELLEITPLEASEILVRLHREQRIEVKSGKLEFERLLEEN